ncbi:hypothetical protein VE01_09618 [Pseudogymnoascus verrucosus]|uniref:SAP domain-containing protein n=1 Tax=Pseudogymnoascus verrucosus TaxID=342668 RepID=A0A1B8G9U6_9PEZI|nr:uncharacterized protein VE01_09618 [Pseudogymnoascus verrucosus]OBT92616.1 hypothetical protein VE01_09618 [Pseudogymnoascus verrucosus]
MTDWNKLKVPELKAELKSRGLSQHGLKAALVARLDEANNEPSAEGVQAESKEGDGNESIQTNTVDNSPEAEKEAPHPEAEIDSAPKPSHEPSTQEDVNKDAQIEVDSKQGAPAQPEATPTSQEAPTQDSSLAEPAVAEAQATPDIESRKRRSLSPPPGSSETSRKRQRKDTELPFTDVDGRHDDVTTTEGDEQWVEKHNNVDTAVINAESEEVATAGGVEEGPTIVDVGKEEVVIEHAGKHTEDTRGRHRERSYKSPSGPAHRRSEDHQAGRDHDMPDAEQERSVAPSIHPATSALYIRNFQRPLNRTQLKDYIAELATAPGQSQDPDVILDFFLDSICTHAFVSFSNTSAASRVRSELHDRIWPDERTRQPLWADFIPYEKVAEWIEAEVTSTAARSGKKWEIMYGVDDDRNVTATLQETGAVPAQIRRQSSSANANAPPAFGRAGPGPVPGAPSGPKADMGRRDNGVPLDGPSDRYNRDADRDFNPYDRPNADIPPVAPFDPDVTYTKATPPVAFVPVTKALAERRLDNIHSLYARDAEDDFRAKSEQHRYSFEGDLLVDRGPEIFPGVRPPPGVRRRGLPRGLLGRGGGGRGGGPRGGRDFGGPRDFGRGDRGYRGGYGGRDEGYGGGFRNDRPPRRGGDSYAGGYDRGDRFDRPQYDRPKDDFGRGPRNGGGGYGGREDQHWRGGSVGMGRRY